MIHLVVEILIVAAIVAAAAAVMTVGEDALQISHVKYVTSMVILHLFVTIGLIRAINLILHSLLVLSNGGYGGAMVV